MTTAVLIYISALFNHEEISVSSGKEKSVNVSAIASQENLHPTSFDVRICGKSVFIQSV